MKVLTMLRLPGLGFLQHHRLLPPFGLPGGPSTLPPGRLDRRLELRGWIVVVFLPGARRGVFVAARPRARRTLLLQRQGIWAAPGHLGSATPQRVVAVDTGNENVQSKL